MVRFRTFRPYFRHPHAVARGWVANLRVDTQRPIARFDRAFGSTSLPRDCTVRRARRGQGEPEENNPPFQPCLLRERRCSSPAQNAFMAQLVPRELLGNASTWNSLIWQLGDVIGPAVGDWSTDFSGPGARIQSSW